MHQEWESVDGAPPVLVREWPYTLMEDVKEDARQYFLQMTRDSVDAPPWPTDIDAWRAAYNPMRAAERWLERKGIDPANVSEREKMLLAASVEIAIAATIYMRGKAAGAPD